MSSLITGATGFIGQSLIRHLVLRGETVIALCHRSPPVFSDIQRTVTWRKFPKTAGEWQVALRGVTTIYHLAWSTLPQSSNANPPLDASDNIISSLQLLEAVKNTGDVRIVFASSGGTVYGTLVSVPATELHSTNPRCAYGVSKLAVEKYFGLYHALWDLDCVALRVSNAYGPGQQVGRNFGAISTFAAHAVAGKPITVFGDGSVVRDYLYIDDLITALVAAGKHRGGPVVMNIGSGVGRSLNDILAVLRQIYTNLEVNYRDERDLDVPVSVLDTSLAKATLEWTPRVSFEVGVERTARSVRQLTGRDDSSPLDLPAAEPTK